MHRTAASVLALVLAVDLAGCHPPEAATQRQRRQPAYEEEAPPSPDGGPPAAEAALPGITMEDTVVGTGAEAKRGDRVVVHYTGTLPDGTKFDSSLDRGEPFEFEIGKGMVIAGWELGVTGMKVGGKRKLVIPPHLAYGERGAGPKIGPNATLHFDIELLDVVPPPKPNPGVGTP